MHLRRRRAGRPDPERRTAFNWNVGASLVVVAAGLAYLFWRKDPWGAGLIILLGLFFGNWNAFGPRVRDWFQARAKKGGTEVGVAAKVNDPDTEAEAEADPASDGATGSAQAGDASGSPQEQTRSGNPR